MVLLLLVLLLQLQLLLLLRLLLLMLLPFYSLESAPVGCSPLLWSYYGFVLFVAPLWIARPWYVTLLRWCLNPVPFSHLELAVCGARHSGMSSAFHVWLIFIYLFA